MRKHLRLVASLSLLGFSLGITPSPLLAQSSNIFSDVNTEATYSTAIDFLKQEKVIEGYQDGSFKPSNTINRAEFIKILIGSLTDTPAGENCFPDVTNQWFAKYVCEAKTRGVVDGYADGNFQPSSAINFAEAAKIIANTYKLDLGDQSADAWFKQYIEALQDKKAIPLSIDYFNEEITRDEMAEIIYRLKADVENKATRTFNEIQGQGLVNVNSCSELDERFKQTMVVDYGYPYGGGIGVREESDAESPTAAPAPTMDAAQNESKSSEGAAGDYSSTNVQEAGVDEADVIKNDGKYIYLIKGNTIRIVEAYPASNLKELSSITLGETEKENFYPSEMYVSGNTLTVIGSVNSYYTPYYSELDATTTDAKIGIYPPYYNPPRTKVYVLDITDRSKVKVNRTVELDGYYSTSRRVDGTLYLVANYYPSYPIWYMDKYTYPSASEVLPKFTDSTTGKDQLLAPCEKVMILPKQENRGINFLITAAIPLDNPTQPISRNVVVGNGENVYASQDNLYVASSVWDWGYWSENSESSSKIYRFSLSPNSINYAAEGVVPGTVLNQFSMDEHLGNLRIATTANSYKLGETVVDNNLYVLNKDLDVIGDVENLAKGERIYSVRFMGDRGYVVTFRNVDPLFVFDLKDPTNPKVIGELKIPGYSDYLHPYDENHLIGFGKDVEGTDTNSSGGLNWTAIKGFKMALFDVTDPNNPKELFKENIGDQGTYSELLYNHKALLFDKEKNLMAFPITVTEMPEADSTQCGQYTYGTCPSNCNKVCKPSVCTTENGVTTCSADCDGANSCQSNEYIYPKTVFMGAYVYGIDLAKGFQLKGKITHLNSQEATDLLRDGYGAYDKSIQRMLYIGENLYSVSQGMVKANQLSDLKEIKQVELAGETYPVYYNDLIMPMAEG
ncbi:MAG: beta-propeller domain-containing protein [Candidatus Altimarinota bacterium]